MNSMSPEKKAKLEAIRQANAARKQAERQESQPTLDDLLVAFVQARETEAERQAREMAEEAEGQKARAIASYELRLKSILGGHLFDALAPWTYTTVPALRITRNGVSVIAHTTIDNCPWQIADETGRMMIYMPNTLQDNRNRPQGSGTALSKVPLTKADDMLLCIAGWRQQRREDLEKLEQQTQVWQDGENRRRAWADEQEQRMKAILAIRPLVEEELRQHIQREADKLWQWPSPETLILYAWSWQVGKDEDGQPQYDRSYSLRATLDDADMVTLCETTIFPERTIKLIPAVHMPVVEKVVCRAVNDLPYQFRTEICNTVPFVDAQGFDGERYHNCLLRWDPEDDSMGRQKVVTIGYDPVQWVKDILDR